MNSDLNDPSPARFGRARLHLRTWLSAVFFLIVAFASKAQPIDLPPATAREIHQGYRNACVIALPAPHVAGTLSALELSEGTEIRRTFHHLGGLRVIAVKSGETPADAIRRLTATGHYQFVEPDYIRTALFVPNDPNFTSQWGLNNSGNNTNVPGPEVAGADIHALSAWNTRTDASSVIVAVLDSGARLTHQDLAANLWTNPSANTDGYINDYHGINAVSTTSNGDPTDDNGHGTHVSGIIGAIGNNNVGVAGVAWKVQLMELKFLDSKGSGDSANAVACIDFAIGHGANIINCSFGGNQFSNSEFTAIRAAAKAGIILVCAAGNNPIDNDLSPVYPADYPSDNIVTVGATDNRDDLTFFTNFGSGDVDLVAPGYQILSLSYSSDTATTWMSGTSMATPMVSGALALMKAQFPHDTYRQLINRILSTVDQKPNLVGRVASSGRLNLAAALSSTSNAPFNDAFSTRGHLAGSTVVVRSSNTGASRESGEPTILGNPGGASLWWDWTAPADGTVSLSTNGSDFASLLAVYTGSSVTSLTPVASAASPTGSTLATLSFSAHAGTTYQISMDGQSGASGFVLLSIEYGNDAFASAYQLSGMSAASASTTYFATSEFGEPNVGYGADGHTMWYTWTAPASGRFELSATSYDFDPAIGVYTGSTLSSLTLVAKAKGSTIDSNAYSPISLASAAFTATAGTVYYFQVDGITDSTTNIDAGQFALSLDDSLWQVTTGDAVTCTPAIGPDGTLYVGSTDSNFYAVNQDGSLRWKYTAGGSFDTISAAISPDGTVYAPCSDGKLYAFKPDGSLKWTYAVPTPTDTTLASAFASSPALASDGTLYVKAEDNHLYAFNPDGTLKWTASVPGFSYASPTIAPDGTIYLGADTGVFYAFNADGSSKWTFTADAPIYTNAAIDGSGHIYFGTLTGSFYSLASDGSQLWTYQAGNSLSSSPALAPDGTLYFASYDHNLYALNSSTGILKWTFRMGHETRASSPAIDANGLIYVGSYDYNVYAVNPDGTLNRIFATGNWVRSSPILYNNRLFFAGNDAQIYAFNIGAAAATSAWPMYQYNPQHPGRAVSTASLPVITAQPLPASLSAGGTLTLSTSASGSGLSYLWRRNGVALDTTAIPSAASASLSLSYAQASDSGSYDCVVTNASGSTTSTAVAVAISAPSNAVNDAQLIAISGRSFTGTGSQIFIAGFYISGSQPKKVLIRASGPALAQYGITGYIPDPVLKLFDVSQTVINQNTGWGTSPNASAIKAEAAALHDFAWADGSNDSALLVTLAPGAYTAQVSGASGDTGVSLVEVYDADAPSTSPRTTSISLRSYVGTGTSVQTAGFVISGSQPKTVLIRAAGPALAAYGVTGTLPDPILKLFDQHSVLIRSNQGWSSDATAAAVIQTTAQRLGAFTFTSGSNDSALLVTLPPGLYTAQVSGASGDTGVGLLEVYDADNQ